MWIFLLIIALPAIWYFVVRWFVRRCATNQELVEIEREGKKELVARPKPRFWCFVPENSTGTLQRKANELKPEGEGSKATPASGSGIIDFIYEIPGMIADRSSANRNEWHLRPCKKGEKDTHRRGLMYRLFGATWIGLNEVRWVKVREVRVGIDDNEVRKYQDSMIEWERNGMQGTKPKRPRYEERTHVYDTLFPYYSREHGVIVLGSETAGAYMVDASLNFKYKETYPIKARIEVADPNAIISELADQETNTLTGSHQPEYYLFTKVPEEPEAEAIPLSERKDQFLDTLCSKVATQALEAVGITIEKAILYSIDMEEKQRELLELQEATNRKKQAEVTESRFNIDIAENNALTAIAVAEGQAEALVINAEAGATAKMWDNLAQADEIETVEGAVDNLEHAEMIRFALAYERNKTVTHLTIAPPGTQPVLPIGSNNAV